MLSNARKVTRVEVCTVCGGDEVLTSIEWRNGREVDVSDPCPECCPDVRETESDRRACADDDLYDQQRDDRMIGGEL
jgi:hypothetical protein